MNTQATNDKQHRAILQSIARQAMLDRDLLPDFSTEALAELDKLHAPASAGSGEPVRDLTNLLWASIDNDDSRDLTSLGWYRAMGEIDSSMLQKVRGNLRRE
ncbi:MAG TPA: hypothetical protein VFK30_03900, partial [Anaerolineae bacterium]|nr:hypothetical protein [Anaerolineae bacterium]